MSTLGSLAEARMPDTLSVSTKAAALGLGGTANRACAAMSTWKGSSAAGAGGGGVAVRRVAGAGLGAAAGVVAGTTAGVGVCVTGVAAATTGVPDGEEAGVAGFGTSEGGPGWTAGAPAGVCAAGTGVLAVVTLGALAGGGAGVATTGAGGFELLKMYQPPATTATTSTRHSMPMMTSVCAAIGCARFATRGGGGAGTPAGGGSVCGS
jgi:hypothetical protein